MKAHEQRIASWLRHDALPLWADLGLDRECGGFVERLTFDGRPDFAVPKRVRVQARQIYVYSHAFLLGLAQEGAEIAGRGYDFLMRYGCPEGARNGFVHSLTRTGEMVDPQRCSYEHAFLLYAFSYYYRATGRRDVLDAIFDVSAAIDAQLLDPAGGGLFSDERRVGERLQNPNMHYFEALIAAADATGRECFIQKADELHTLFRSRIFSRSSGTLGEYYRGDWSPAPGERGRIVEPGHLCEWVWLLKRYADQRDQPIAEESFRLFDFVAKHGRPSGLLLCDEVWDNGEVKSADTRSWPQTEAIKAYIAMAEAGQRPLDAAADRLIDALFQHFLNKPFKGAWVDWIGADGRALVETVPASTFYHLFLSFSEYLGHRDG